YDESLERLRQARLKAQTTLSLLNTGQQVIIAFGLVAMLWRATQGVVDGRMTLGDLVMVNAFMIQLYIPLNFLGVIYREIKQSLTDLDKMFTLMEREREIEKFVSEEYWTIEAEFSPEREAKSGQRAKKEEKFRATLHSINGKRAELKNGEETEVIRKELEKAHYLIGEVRQTKSQRRPTAPFTTSTLQQEASRKLNYSSKKTMIVAQMLYEGVELSKEEGTQGLITYMRTDSTNVAVIAQEEARKLIESKYGADYVPEKPPVYTKKAKGAQEAHEAIRPTSALREPDAIKEFLTVEQYKLYRLVWQRFVASQMAPAQLDNTSVDVKAGAVEQTPAERPYLFRATGSVIRFPGFLVVYQEGLDDGAEDELSKKALPDLTAGLLLKLKELLSEQHFTQPPPRFTEATLVKTLEELGIGRPSTYAPTLSTIQDRYYVVKVEKKFEPTELGTLVNNLLVEFFPSIVDTNFTSQMEDNLDEIADGKKFMTPVLTEFYSPFEQRVIYAQNEMTKVELVPELAGIDCEKCGRPMYIKMGKYGRFIACPGFPECRNAKAILKKIGMVCPKCTEGDVVMRRTKKKRTFYGCSRYPDCDFSVWERPIIQPCPSCNGLMTLSGKRNAKCTVCATVMEYELPDEEEQTPTRTTITVRSQLSEAVKEGGGLVESESEEIEESGEREPEEEHEVVAAL
ncbi:MAG: type I DNA topoisomerase, partial [Chloroflexota bacterium]